ncbi:precorrin-8X/cobalt-precorrin-8 methylmutase [Methanolinea mesophila]|uniref:precorrin-8X methylmutase n=1 Tax=Methanolinea mesophila TaxID=547055 RepID=UPI001AE58870|nr:precorrin-8X methylmutase [Methanolinea mesophila]MBP1929605.1 precorrin-8X/cobalt-precorrin-8 methylmutase [Methanolinea mesophila]
MPEESLHPGDTIKNTYTDPGATTREALEISEKSRKLARSAVGNESPEDRIRQRCSIAVGDFSMAELMVFLHNPVGAGLAALEAGAPLITDIRMVQTGILKKGHRSEVLCALDYGQGIAAEKGITRTSAGLLELGPRIDGAVVVIGNAPSALLSLCGMIREGRRPRLVIGTPVGFVNAAESKDELRSLSVPSISNRGTRGGTPVAVAAMNELIVIHTERSR